MQALPILFTFRTYAVKGCVGREAPHTSLNYLGFSHAVRKS
jgi:hypothetical protein